MHLLDDPARIKKNRAGLSSRVSEGTCQPDYIRAGLDFDVCRRGDQPGNNLVIAPFTLKTKP